MIHGAVRRFGAGRDLDDAIVPLFRPVGQPTPGRSPASSVRIIVVKSLIDLNQTGESRPHHNATPGLVTVGMRNDSNLVRHR